MPLDNPTDILRRQQLEKLDAIRQRSDGEDPIVVPASSELDELHVHFRYLDALSTGPFVSHLVELERKGISLQPGEMLSDEELSEKLWEVIEGLAECQVFLSSTDHLSDRELYEHLRTESLLEEHPDLPMGANACIHLDILGGCSEEDMFLYNKYYADEADRQRLREEYPDEALPDHVDPPYDRDQHLPQHEIDRHDEMDSD